MTRGKLFGKFLFPLLGLLLLLLTAGAVSAGAVSIPVRNMGAFLLSRGQRGLTSGQIYILFHIRLPRILMAGSAGAALALGGCTAQAVFRNPMAEPYLLGISSGASLGAAVYFLSGFDLPSLPFLGVMGFAFAGSLVTLFLIMAVAGQYGGNFGSLLLGGIAFSAIAQAGVSLMMMLKRDKADRIIFWMMGSFSSARWSRLFLVLAALLPGVLYIFLHRKELDLLSLGNEEAHALGMNPEREGRLLLLATCLMTAAVTAACGIIGFTGLIVPHIMRALAGGSHRRLPGLCLLGGAILMILSDLAARSLLSPSEIPVGVITALTGGPFFLYLLRHSFGGGRT